MTGPEHYRKAERLLRDEYRTDRSVAEAQVHATLALAAATRDAGIPRGMVLVERCDIAESAHGRQCIKAAAHTGGCDFGDGEVHRG
ncbi:hypothetical protein [Streptomyces sp. NPDC051310]|uniref:hypothetical protein n=1 Tax=Streptomyces sp. NPDC051310 TaxID=3365649 RepID=UPI0037A481FB